MTMPGWPARDWRAFIALAASIAGSAVLTGLLAWTIRLLEAWRETEAIATIAYGLIAIIGSVLLSLGLAINRRSIRLSREGFEASGGEGGGGETL
jgi:chromate transport protein ChrA